MKKNTSHNLQNIEEAMKKRKRKTPKSFLNEMVEEQVEEPFIEVDKTLSMKLSRFPTAKDIVLNVLS